MPEVRALARQYGYRHVYLATDSQQVVDDTRRFPDFEWLYLRDVNRSAALRSRVRVEKLIKTAALDGFEEGWSAARDVLLMARADGFIGKFTSNMDRMVIALMSALKGGCLPPFVSLDSNWCFDHGLDAGFNTQSSSAFQC